MPAFSNLRYLDDSRVIPGVQSPRDDICICNAQSNDISPSLPGPPCVRPKTPCIVCSLVTILDVNKIFLRIEPYLQLLGGNRPSPKNSRDSVGEHSIHGPLLDSNGHGGRLDDGRLVFSR